MSCSALKSLASEASQWRLSAARTVRSSISISRSRFRHRLEAAKFMRCTLGCGEQRNKAGDCCRRTHGMSLVQEYRRQFPWRDWPRALALCPITPGQHILDLGCGPGDLSAALAARGLKVTGIDRDPELLAAARTHAPDVHFEQQDLSDLRLPAAAFDGIWCSFAAAYFVDFAATFARWCTFLQPTAWVCLIEIDDLLGHEPRSEATGDTIERFYDAALEQRGYDFRAGRRLASILEMQRFQTTATELADRE